MSSCKITSYSPVYKRAHMYCIRAIRRCGYYLFHQAILCGFYSSAATNREQHLLNSVVWVKVFCKCKGFERSQFYEINEELRCGDLVLKQNFQLSLDQLSLSYKAVGTWNLQSVYWRRWRWVAGEWTLFLKTTNHLSHAFLNSNYGILFACFWYCHWVTRFVHVRTRYSNISRMSFIHCRFINNSHVHMSMT